MVLDLNPSVTPNNVLTNALNATMITRNGNERSLQNDMGNGRVETAFLPQGYVPIGTCEFGDIIYIASYNPLTNRSQIGCFPSPERNISTEELGSPNVTIQSSDFQEIQLETQKATGNLVASSKLYALYDKKLNPGDKFFISYNDQKKTNEGMVASGVLNNVTDFKNNDHLYGYFPKLVKIHIVSIEDSGKIVYMDSDVKWYDNYILAPTEQSEDGTNVDIDSYRGNLEKGYSIFKSKVSGKLALLVELEQIDSFTCTHIIQEDVR